jgi:hypothetical protein
MSASTQGNRHLPNEQFGESLLVDCVTLCEQQGGFHVGHDDNIIRVVIYTNTLCYWPQRRIQAPVSIRDFFRTEGGCIVGNRHHFFACKLRLGRDQCSYFTIDHSAFVGPERRDKTRRPDAIDDYVVR